MDVAALRAWLRRHPQLADAALGLVLLAVPALAVLTGMGPQKFHNPGADDLAAALAGLALVTVRRRWPRATLASATAVCAVFIVATGVQHPLMIAAWAFAAYTFATRTDRRRTWVVGGACIVALYVVTGFGGAGGWLTQHSLGAAAWGIAALALGDAQRSRGAYIAEIEARARRAEESREEEARRRVAEERLRIARELHDVVAHHIAVINVQAGAAAHVLASRPDAAGPALAHIRTASDTVMKELASVVGLLRGPAEPGTAAAPTRGLDRLEELIATFTAAGLRVTCTQSGPVRPLPAVVDLAAFRIVQESLTNAHKHGTGQASVSVTYTGTGVAVAVENPVAVRDEPAPGPGYGLIGMRERATAAGGTVTAAPTGPDRFAVRAHLPAPPLEAP